MITGAGFRMSVSMTDCRRSRLGDGQKPAKRVQQIRKERDELERIYEATWLELENAIGSKAAEAIRKSVEETTEAGAVQLRAAAREEEKFRSGRRSKMQPVNGVDQAHDADNLISAHGTFRGFAAAPEDLKVKLKEPLPREAVSPNPQMPGLSGIKVIYVVERLNDVFGLNGWHIDNEIVETGRMVVVRATLTIPKYSIAIEQFGGNDNPDRGDAYKGACTDALSKCASYLGIGMDVYKGCTMSAPETAAALTRTDRGPRYHSPPRGQHRCRTALRAGTPRPLASRVGTWLHASPACGASWECLNTATFSAGTAIAK